ncbi:MAG: transposase [Mariprofundus sp.]|nr:transposase [Mariprofundus sp.]
MKRRRPCTLVKGKDHKTVVDFADVLERKKGHRTNITDVSCDMSPAFIKGVRAVTECLSHLR